MNASSFSFEKFTEEKVIEAIKSLDSCSSCGITEVPVSVIKNSAEVLAPFLTSIFNECITSGKIPKDLKCAIAFPLFKKRDSSLCDNYRGIGVLSPFAKVLERLLSHQITNFFNSQKIFSPEQHGFRSNHSCEQLFKRFWTNGKYSWRKKRTFWPYLLILKRLLILLIQNFSSLNSFTMVLIIHP